MIYTSKRNNSEVKAHLLGRARHDTRAQLKRLYIKRKRGDNMTAYEANIVRHMREDKERYSRQLRNESGKQQPNEKVVVFLKKHIEFLDEAIKSYEEKEEEKRKQAADKLRRLVNTNFKENSIKLELSYKPKTETSLLTVNK